MPEINLRSALVKFIREVARDQGRHYQLVYFELYSQFYYRYGINIVTRAKKQGMSTVEYAEENEYLEDLYALARKIYK